MMEKPNIKYIDELADGDTDFKLQFIHILKMEFPHEKEEYEKNIIKKNYIDAALNVHKLKHKFNVLGLERGYRTAIEHEEKLKQNNDSLERHFFTILETIEAYLKSI